MTKVLIVEDEPTILANVARMLRLEGFEVVVAHDGAEGLDQAHAQRPDIILCDIRMPGMDGDQMLEQLRAQPATAAIPLIFTTASAESSGREQRLQRGASDYLIKPYAIAELLAAIRRHLP